MTLTIVTANTGYPEAVALAGRHLSPDLDLAIEFTVDTTHPRRHAFAVRILDLTAEPARLTIDVARTASAGRRVFADCHRGTASHLALSTVTLGGIAAVTLLDELVVLPTLAARQLRRASWVTDRLMEEIQRDQRAGAPRIMTGYLGTRLSRELRLITRLIGPAGPRSGGDPRFGRASELIRAFATGAQFGTGDVVAILDLAAAGYTDPARAVRRAGRDADLGVVVPDQRGRGYRMYRAGEIDPLRDAILTGSYLTFACRHRQDRRICPKCSGTPGLASTGQIVTPRTSVTPSLRDWLLAGVHKMIRQFGA